MGMTVGTRDTEYFARTSGLVVLFTIVLTTNFIGVMALLTGEASGTMARLPWYVFLAAVVFVAVIIVMEAADAAGQLVLRAAVTASVLGFGLIVLAGEGVVFAVEQPSDVFNSRLLLYFLSAAVIATGLGYWALRHWREFSDGRNL